MAQALYAKNGALCVRNGALVVGTADAEPPCVCGQGGGTINDACCPTVLPAYLPPRGVGVQAFGPISVTYSIFSNFTQVGGLSPNLPPPVTINTVQSLDFSGVVQMERQPSSPCPRGMFTATTVETVTIENDDENSFPQYIPGVYVRNLVNDYFILFSKTSNRVDVSMGSVQWSRQPGESRWVGGNPAGTSVISPLGPTLTATFNFSGPVSPGNSGTQIYSASISTLSACVASALFAGCTNCADNLTGGATL